MKQFTLKLSDKQRSDLIRLGKKLAIDRASVLRLALARLVEEEDARDPVRDANPRA